MIRTYTPDLDDVGNTYIPLGLRLQLSHLPTVTSSGCISVRISTITNPLLYLFKSVKGNRFGKHYTETSKRVTLVILYLWWRMRNLYLTRTSNETGYVRSPSLPHVKTTVLGRGTSFRIHLDDLLLSVTPTLGSVGSVVGLHHNGSTGCRLTSSYSLGSSLVFFVGWLGSNLTTERLKDALFVNKIRWHTTPLNNK